MNRRSFFKKNRFYRKKYRKNNFNRFKKRINFNFKFDLFFKKNWTRLGISILIIFFIYFLFFSNFFIIREIYVDGLIRTESKEIKNLVNKYFEKSGFFPRDNFFLFSKKNLLRELNSYYSFSQVKFQRFFPRKLNIFIQERKYSYIFREDEIYYYVDFDNYIVSEINPENLNNIKNKRYPIIFNKTGESKITKDLLRKVNLDFDYINVISESFVIFRNDSRFEVDKFIIEDELNSFKIAIKDGPQLYLNVKEKASKQLSKFFASLSGKLRENFWSLNYIDLRYGNKIFYR